MVMASAFSPVANPAQAEQHNEGMAPLRVRKSHEHKRLESVVEAREEEVPGSPKVGDRKPATRGIERPPPLSIDNDAEEPLSPIKSANGLGGEVLRGEEEEQLSKATPYLPPETPMPEPSPRASVQPSPALSNHSDGTALSYRSEGSVVYVSQLFRVAGSGIALVFRLFWRDLSLYLTIAATFTLAMRANYILQFGNPSYDFAIPANSGDKELLLATSFWFPFAFMLMFLLEAFICCFHRQLVQAAVDLSFTVPSFVSLVLSQVVGRTGRRLAGASGSSPYDEFGGGFGTARPYAFNVLDYIPVLLILRIFRKDIAVRINTFAQKFILETRDRRTKNLAKSFAAQEKFEAGRRIGEAEAAHLIEEQHKIGTIVELWYAAVKNHADVVDAHGPFSGHLLRAMLEIPEQGHRGTSRTDDSNETAKSTPDEDDATANTRRAGRTERPSSYESFEDITFPDGSGNIMLFDNAWRKMPPLLTEWENIVIAVDRDHYVLRYFSIQDHEFLGRIKLDDVAKVTLSCLVLPGGDKRKISYLESAKKNLGFVEETPGALASPASTSALSKDGVRDPAVERSALQVMLLLKQGQILYIRFSSSEDFDLNTTASTMHSTFSRSRAREFANLVCELTRLELHDTEEEKLAGNKHRRRISVKW